ncbi:MAG: glycosyltransferase [Spirochaetaceae bacterium]|jgi:cellulose synthase/poly-beta-1,6-N-acetylglucosamine synthase-like glycosyltransferase|nr:glycosyltransferase [Spirochaetaceae bacterium]
MNLFIAVCIIHSVLILSTHIVLLGGLVKEFKLKKPAVSSDSGHAVGGVDTFPLVSVVIPARNEEGRIANLLESLERQSYPNVEYIFINDRSTDSTLALLESFMGKIQARGQRALIINLTGNPGPNHKQFALAKGIAEAQGEFLLFTDADCTVSTEWIVCMMRLMTANERCGIIIAPVFKKSIGNTFLSRYQCLDHAVRCVYLVGTTGFGAGFCGFGNNLMLRKAALDEAGGYAMVPWSLTEDAALISHIRAKTCYTVEAAPLPHLFVFTESETSWQALTNQTLRWNNGALFSRDFRTRFSYAYLMWTVFTGLLALPAGLFWKPPLLLASAGPLVVILLMNLCALLLFGKNIPKSRFAYIPEIVFMPFMFSYLTLMGAFGIIPIWKDNKPQKF